MTERQALRQARELLGLGREDAAQLTGITGRTIQNWEDGNGGITTVTIAKLREYIRALAALAEQNNIEIGLPPGTTQPELLLAPDCFVPKPVHHAEREVA